MDPQYAQCDQCGAIEEADGGEYVGGTYRMCRDCGHASDESEWRFGDADDFSDVLEEHDSTGETEAELEHRIRAAQLELAHGKLEELEAESVETGGETTDGQNYDYDSGPKSDAQRLREAINAEAWHDIAEFVGEAEAMERAGAWRG